MPYKLSENKEKHYVIVTHSGELSLDELKLVQLEVSTLINIREWTKIYIDAREIVFHPAFHLMDHYILTESHKFVLPSNIKIAVVGTREQQLHGKNIDAAGRLAEVNIKVFYSEELALEWLG